nr:monothiol glutaredoxin-S17 [Tanacetum cinerariifolium]
MGSVKDVNSKEEVENLVKDGSAVMLNFWASWCDASKHMDQVFSHLSTDFPNAHFLRVEAEEQPEISEAYSVSAVPFFVFIKTDVQKIMRRYLTETNEYVFGSGRKSTVDHSSYTIGYHKMKSLVINITNEIVSDIEMHDKQVLHTFIDLPCLYTCLYSSQLSNRMGAFLAACPPVSLSPPVSDLVITTCDFQKDLLDWNIRIKDKRLELLESCKLCKQGRSQDQM